jgi:predicted small lipoprotein YifL
VRNYFLGLLIAMTALAIAACGGQGAPGTPYPAVNTTGATLSTSAPQTVTMPAATGLAVGTAKLSGSGTVSVSQSVSNPSGVPVLAIGKPKTSATATPAPSGNTPIAYITLTAQTAATLTQVTFSVSPTSTPPSGTYYLAFWNGAQWVTIGSPAQFSGGVVTVSSGTISPAVSLAAGASYYFAIYTGQIFVTPTPPPPPPVASPSSLSLSVGQTGPITVTSGAQITITAASSNTAVATVTPQSASTGTGTTATFTVKGVSVGSATITFTDPLGHTGTTTVDVNNNSPTPSPSPPGTNTIGLGDAAPLGISADPNTQITITTSSYTIAALATGSPGPVPSPVGAAPTTFASTSSVTMTTDSSGAAYFWVQGASGGYATISLSDIHGNTSTIGLTISPITNGTFANGSTNWAPCSYAHSAGASPVNAASPYPNTPEPVQTGSPTAETPVPLGSLSPLVSVTGPPANDNPGWSDYTNTGLTPNTGSVTFSQNGNSETVTTPGGAPSVLGSHVILLGSIEGDIEAYPLGTFGVCQTFTVPTPVPNVSGQGDPQLSLYVLEGGTEYTFKEADQEATLFASYSSNVASTLDEYLFAEQDCYVHPTTATPPGVWGGASITGGGAGCWPAAYGGDPSGYENWLEGGFWSPRGPYDISAYAGQTVTLFLGNWSYFHETHSYNAQFMYVGNVQVTFSSAFPTTAPYLKGRPLGTITLTNRSVQSKQPIR